MENTVELKLAEISTWYREKWNINESGMIGGYCHMYVDGKIVNNTTLYRIGGMGGIKKDKKYNLVLKHVEELYDTNIAKT